jgi:hypothetical protein
MKISASAKLFTSTSKNEHSITILLLDLLQRFCEVPGQLRDNAVAGLGPVQR